MSLTINNLVYFALGYSLAVFSVVVYAVFSETVNHYYLERTMIDSIVSTRQWKSYSQPRRRRNHERQ